MKKKKKSKVAFSYDREGVLESGLSIFAQILMTIGMLGLAYTIYSS